MDHISLVIGQIDFTYFRWLTGENILGISTNQIFSQVQNCLLEKMDDDILLYNPANTLTLHLNESSSLIWQLLDGKASVAELITMLKQQFPESKMQIENDVIEVLTKMQENGVIQEIG